MFSLVPLPWLSGMQDFQDHLMKNWLQTQSEIQCSMYVQPFAKNGHPNPTLDEDGKPAFILQQEFRSFKNTDPEEKHQ
jgi:hypothetical protein